MSLAPSPLKIDDIAARFGALLSQNSSSLDSPALAGTWDAFAAFCREVVECDSDRLFFEAELSAVEPDAYYVHFVRTCYGRRPKGHEWSHEVICDFLFPLDETLEELNYTAETDELGTDKAAREEFLTQVQNQKSLWEALAQRRPTKAEIYIGES